MAFFAAVASASSSGDSAAALAATAAASSRLEISSSGSSNTSGLGTTNMHRCMFCTTAHALTVSPAVFFASTGTRPKRNTVPGAEMSSGNGPSEAVQQSLDVGEPLPAGANAQPVEMKLASRLPAGPEWLAVGENLVAVDADGRVSRVYHDMLP